MAVLEPGFIPKFTAHEVYPGLWQGSAPPAGDHLRQNGYTHVALCAIEHQPPASWFRGVRTIYAPNDDNFDGLTRNQVLGAISTARAVANAVRDGGKVLVTCRMGQNRSGLVSAIAIHMLTGKPGFDCVQMVKQGRPKALRNPAFVEMLSRLT